MAEERPGDPRVEGSVPGMTEVFMDLTVQETNGGPVLKLSFTDGVETPFGISLIGDSDIRLEPTYDFSLSGPVCFFWNLVLSQHVIRSICAGARKVTTPGWSYVDAMAFGLINDKVCAIVDPLPFDGKCHSFELEVYDSHKKQTLRKDPRIENDASGPPTGPGSGNSGGQGGGR